MPTYVEIAVNIPQVSGVFHYHLPPSLEGQIKSGHLVTVPFGPQLVQGVVLREVAEPAVPETRAVDALLDREAVLTSLQIQLADELARATLAPVASCVALMLPAGLSQQADTLYELSGSFQGTDRPTRLQQRIIALLQKRGPLRGRQLDRGLPKTNWRRSIKGLVQRAVVKAEPVLPEPRVQPKQVRTARLSVPPEQARMHFDSLGRTDETRARRQAMLSALIREAESVDVTWLYAESGGKLADLRVLDEKGLVMLGESEIWRDPLEQIQTVRDVAPRLTTDQWSAWLQIRQRFEQLKRGSPARPLLLHGVTGSGKTELYLRAVAEALQQGRNAIVLVPEIALTPQTVRRFMARFPGQVGLAHSRLSTGERYDTWRRARDGRLKVIVGPRSALFLPLPDVGLIVVDEFHDSSYYQSEQLPYYHARQAAILYARLAEAVCILGSATPGAASMYLAEQGQWKLLRLPRRILAHKAAIGEHLEKVRQLSGGKLPAGSQNRFREDGEDVMGADLPPIRVADMRQELKAGNRSIFSRALQETLGQTLEQSQQAILFLNRRGAATYVFCRDCGHSLQCNRCEEVALTFHRDQKALVCHHCGYRRNQPKKCPQCGSTRIRYYGTGTERVEAEVQALFPRARTLRWDWSTTRQKDAHEIILSHFVNQRADVLIGTQMLAKGLDLPLVTLVGIVLAEVGLNLPDYRAGERTFQVLSQVAGRAGRSVLGGQVILQTFDPRHYVLQAVAAHDYESFYQQELAYRRQLGYPPFGQIVRLEFRHRDSALAEKNARNLGRQLERWIGEERRTQTDLIGPAPCFFTRLDGYYRWQIILRGPDPAAVLRYRKIGDWKIEVNPQSLL